MEEHLQMFLNFRKTCDELSFPLLAEWAGASGDYKEITFEGQVVGFLMIIEGYVEGIYVKPEFRRKGLAKKAVLDFVKDGGFINKLHIIRTNKAAQKFWNSVFYLKKIDECPVDALYQVESVKPFL